MRGNNGSSEEGVVGMRAVRGRRGGRQRGGCRTGEVISCLLKAAAKAFWAWRDGRSKRGSERRDGWGGEVTADGVREARQGECWGSFS